MILRIRAVLSVFRRVPTAEVILPNALTECPWSALREHPTDQIKGAPVTRSEPRLEYDSRGHGQATSNVNKTGC